MDKYQKFILNKIQDGFQSVHINQPLNDDDLKKLSAKAKSYKDYSQDEWNEWTKKIHWALQVSFSIETDNRKNIDAVEVWRQNVVNTVKNSLERSSKDTSLEHLLIVDSAALHFFKTRFITSHGRYIWI